MPRIHRLATPVVTLGLLLAAPRPGPAQSQPNLFFDTVDVHVVNVEVTVTDRDGRPVTGLTRDDFHLFEDGRPVEVSNFASVEDRRLIGAEAGAATETTEASPDPATARTDRLQLVVFVDNQNIGPQHRKEIFDRLRTYFRERLDPRDRVMLVANNDAVEVAQDFTSDPELLAAALDRLEKRVGSYAQADAQKRLYLRSLSTASLRNFDPNGTERDTDFEAAVLQAERSAQELRMLGERLFLRTRNTVTALQRFSESLSGLPGRKAMLYVSDGLPVRPAESLSQAWINKYDTWLVQNQQFMDSNARSELNGAMTSLSSLSFDASDDFKDLVVAASADRVAFYPIAAIGGSSTSVSAEYPGSGTASGRGPVDRDVVATDVQSREDSLLSMAEGTGGLAFTRSPNVEGLIERVTRDFTSFYSLGYSPDHPRDDKFHTLEVKVDRPDVVVRHVQGYREKDPIEQLQALTLSAAFYDVQANPLGARLQHGEVVKTGSDRYRLPLQIQVPFQKLLLLPQDEFHTGRLTVFLVVRAEGGGLSPMQRIEIPLKVPNAKILEVLKGAASYPVDVELRGGNQRISVGVRDDVAQVSSMLTLTLDVGGAGEKGAGT